MIRANRVFAEGGNPLYQIEVDGQAVTPTFPNLRAAAAVCDWLNASNLSLAVRDDTEEEMVPSVDLSGPVPADWPGPEDIHESKVDRREPLGGTESGDDIDVKTVDNKYDYLKDEDDGGEYL